VIDPRARAAAILVAVDLTAEMMAPCRPEELFEWVDDLARYPAWLNIVQRAEPVPGDAVDLGDGPAWAVELRGRLGPFARSKALRMVRSRLSTRDEAVFRRQETDGRKHAPWMLRARVTADEVTVAGDGPTAPSSTLSMHLHYGGGLWGPMLERMLADEIDDSRERLRALVTSPRP
jgi:Polyketide cyclase / dehydrase and lipid transport